MAEELTDRETMFIRMAPIYGLTLGLFWVIKYPFLIWGYNSPSCMLVYFFLSIFGIYLFYKNINHFRITIGGNISFKEAWLMGVLNFFLAGLIVSLAHYVTYRFFLPQDFLNNVIQQTIDTLQSTDINSEVTDSLKEVNLTPIQMAVQGIFNNTFYGILLSCPIAFIVSRKHSGQQPIA